MRTSSWRLPKRLSQAFEQMASSSGWEPCGYADDEGRFLWFRKRIFADYFAVLSIGLASRDVGSGMQLHAAIAAAFVEREDREMPDSCLQAYSMAVGDARYTELLRVSAAWLLVRWPPAFGSFSDAQALLLIPPGHEEYDVTVAKIFPALVVRADDFARHVDSHDKLAACLLDLPNFPGQGLGAGPQSAAPKLMAASVLMHAGKRELAMDVVGDALREAELLKLDGELDESDVREMHRIAECLKKRC